MFPIWVRSVCLAGYRIAAFSFFLSFPRSPLSATYRSVSLAVGWGRFQLCACALNTVCKCSRIALMRSTRDMIGAAIGCDVLARTPWPWCRNSTASFDQSLGEHSPIESFFFFCHWCTFFFLSLFAGWLVALICEGKHVQLQNCSPPYSIWFPFGNKASSLFSWLVRAPFSRAFKRNPVFLKKNYNKKTCTTLLILLASRSIYRRSNT